MCLILWTILDTEYQVLRYFDRGNSRIDVDIFSSEQERSTKFDVTSPRALNSLNSSNTLLVACGRMLYRLSYKRGDMVDCVLAFDPFSNDPAQILHIIDLPLEARDIPCMACKLGMC